MPPRRCLRRPRSRGPAPLRRIELSLPEIHCAACITGVERTLLAEPGVAAARANLSLRRASATVEDAPGNEARLIAALEARGYAARPLDSAALEATRTDAEGRDLLARIGVAGFAAMNVMFLSIAVWSGASDTTRDLLHWVSAAIALPAVAFAALPFFRSALAAIGAGRLDMDLPISLALVMAAAVSPARDQPLGPARLFRGGDHADFLPPGRPLPRPPHPRRRPLRRRRYRRARGADGRPAAPGRRPRDRAPRRAAPRRPDRRRPRRPHPRRRHRHRRPLRGRPVAPDRRDPAAAGRPRRGGQRRHAEPDRPADARARALGDDTLIRQIARLVEAAERSRSRYATLAERAARAYAPLVLGLAAAALAWWGAATGDWRVATNIAAAVLIITCPCGLGLAVPAVLTAASGRLFRDGVLLKDGTALERLAEIDAVVFDKTGTLTTGRPVLTNAAAIPAADFAAAAALAAASAHPLARAIRVAAAEAGISPAAVADIAEHPGLGTEGRLGGRTVRLGRAEWVGAAGDAAVTTSWLRVGREPAVAFSFADELRPDAPATVAALRAAGLPVALLSGDAERPVREHSPRGSASPTGPPAPRRRRRSPAWTRSAPRAAAC